MTKTLKPSKPYYANGGWHCQHYNSKGKLVQVFVPDKSDDE